MIRKYGAKAVTAYYNAAVVTQIESLANGRENTQKDSQLNLF